MSAILNTITRALNEYGIAPTTFGRMAVGDPRFVQDLQRGRELRRKTEDSVVAFLATLADVRRHDAPQGKASRREGITAELVRHRIAMRDGSKALLAAILSAKGEASA